MKTQVLEGTIPEIIDRLGGLRRGQKRLRVTVEELDVEPAHRETRNGITLVPIESSRQVVTSEMVKHLIDQE